MLLFAVVVDRWSPEESAAGGSDDLIDGLGRLLLFLSLTSFLVSMLCVDRLSCWSRFRRGGLWRFPLL